MIGRRTARFLVSGVLATLADALTYAGLMTSVLPDHPDVSKALSFVAGTGVAFLLARAWTFSDVPRREGQGLAFLALYTTAFVLNVTVHGVLLRLLLSFAGTLAAPTAFVIATGASTVLNGVGQRHLVFRAG